MQPSDSLPLSATTLVPLAVASLDAGTCSVPLGPTTRVPANVSCVGDGSPALRSTGIGRGEARASQVPGPSSSCVPWSNTPPETRPSSPNSRRGRCGLQVIQHPGHPGRLEVSGPHTPWPTRSHAYASQALFPSPAQDLLPAWAGSPLAGQDSHLLDDEQSFMETSHPPIPFDQPCLVALNCLLYGVNICLLLLANVSRAIAGFRKKYPHVVILTT